MTIVKVQIPLDTNRSEAIVYAKGRLNLKQQTIDAKTRNQLKGDIRGFFEAEFKDGTVWVIGKRVPEQLW